MHRILKLATAVSGLALIAGPALAEGKTDRARAAIAEARGKVETLGTINAAGDVPRLVAQAQAALRTAEDDLKGSHKEQAIADAHRASELADTAIGLSQKQQQQSQAADVAAAAATTAAAERQAADANARAAAAEQAADAAAADAAAARTAAATPAPAPAPQPVTVTTETTKVSSASTTQAAPHRTVRRVVHHRTTKRAPTVTEKTTTTVSTN
ncbi:hypothetical protein [Sphingomonas beigongshangi]|jgi:septal ring factor EnvC (AmiA/AmiB activator)|uniref:hypothetical protein n=1 Tax=Sphingomonas beigongshangi TaxID=2782540 RepID=UPI001AEEDF70|nr:hypothetical protein [Sphingomonas beigongshangi]